MPCVLRHRASANKENRLQGVYCYISEDVYYVYMFMTQGEHYEFTGRQIRGRRQIRLIKDLECGDLRVPRGFLCDGATIPRFADDLLGLDPLRDEYLYAAVIHDYCYSRKWSSRWECDRLFGLNILKGTNRPLRWIFAPIMLFSVRIGGFEAYYGQNLPLWAYYWSKLRD